MDDVLYRVSQIDLADFLSKNKLFYDLETVMGNLILLIQDRKLQFSADSGGLFAHGIVFKILDETTGFLGCIKQGSFYSAFHHSRALIELYAIINYCFSKEGQNSGALVLFEQYKVLRRHVLYLELEDGNNQWNFSEENKQFFKKNYSSLDPKILEVFKFKNIEEARKEIKLSSSWLPRKIIRFNEMIEKAGIPHSANYEKLCYYAHFSPLSDRTQKSSFGLPDWWEEMLTITADYTFKCYAFVHNTNYITDESKQLLNEVFSKLEPALLLRVTAVLNNSKLKNEKCPLN